MSDETLRSEADVQVTGGVGGLPVSQGLLGRKFACLVFLKKGLKQRSFSEHKNRTHKVNANSWHSPYMSQFCDQKMASVLWLLIFPSRCNLDVEGVGMLWTFNVSSCMCCTCHRCILFSCVLSPQCIVNSPSNW